MFKSNLKSKFYFPAEYIFLLLVIFTMEPIKLWNMKTKIKQSDVYLMSVYSTVLTWVRNMLCFMYISLFKIWCVFYVCVLYSVDLSAYNAVFYVNFIIQNQPWVFHRPMDPTVFNSPNVFSKNSELQTNRSTNEISYS